MSVQDKPFLRSARRKPEGRIRSTNGRLGLIDEAYWLPWASVFVVLGIWELLASSGLLSPFFGSPRGTIQAALDTLPSGAFWADVRVSAVEFAVGYLLGMVFGVSIGLGAGWYRRVGFAIEPWLNGLNAAPRIALLPLITLWVGIGPPATTTVIFVGVFLLVALNTFDAVRTVPTSLVRVADSFGASHRRIFFTVVIPSALPFVIAGARLGIGRAVVGLMVGEFYGSQNGLGNFIFTSGATGQVDLVIFGALFITILSFGAFVGLSRLERRFHSWRPEMAGGV